MYDRRLTPESEPFLFGNTSALYESDMILVDHETGSFWMQVSGEALMGTLAGERLTALPSQTTTWGLWREQYPNSAVLSKETGYSRNYADDTFTGRVQERLDKGADFVFPVSETGNDSRLEKGEVVLGAEYTDGKQYVWPIERIGNGVINDFVGEDRKSAVAVFSSEVGPTGVAYLSEVSGQTLTFVYRDRAFFDEQTNSEWSFAGEAISGPLQGKQLEALPSRSTFWFSMITSFPDLILYDLETE